MNVSVIDLMVFGVIQGCVSQDKRGAIEQFLFEDGYLEGFENDARVAQLLDMWVEYVKSPKENVKMYDKIKKYILFLWEKEEYFYYILDNTYLLHREDWLLKNNISIETIWRTQ
jgi:hypothetical protein